MRLSLSYKNILATSRNKFIETDFIKEAINTFIFESTMIDNIFKEGDKYKSYLVLDEFDYHNIDDLVKRCYHKKKKDLK